MIAHSAASSFKCALWRLHEWFPMDAMNASPARHQPYLGHLLSPWSTGKLFGKRHVWTDATRCRYRRGRTLPVRTPPSSAMMHSRKATPGHKNGCLAWCRYATRANANKAGSSLAFGEHHSLIILRQPPRRPCICLDRNNLTS